MQAAEPGATFASAMRDLLKQRGITFRALAARTYYSKSYLHLLATGSKRPTDVAARRIDDALGAGGALAALAARDSSIRRSIDSVVIGTGLGDTFDVYRRTVLAALAAATVNGLAQTSAELELVNLLIEGSDRASTVDEWQEVVWEHGIGYLSASRPQFLCDVATDLATLDTVLAGHTGPPRRGLADAGARLAALVAMACTDLGRDDLARRAWRVARRHAAESGSAETDMWVRGQESTLGSYAGRTPAVVLALAERAMSRADAPAGAGGSVAMAAHIQALASTGRTDEALAELPLLHRALDALPDATTSNTTSIFGWTEFRVRHTESFVHAHVDSALRAHRVHDEALAAYPEARTISRCQVHLHRAANLIRDGDIGDGIQHAMQAIEAVPIARRGRFVLTIADKVAAAVPEPENVRSEVQAFRSMLADTKAAAPQSTSHG